MKLKQLLECLNAHRTVVIFDGEDEILTKVNEVTGALLHREIGEVFIYWFSTIDEYGTDTEDAYLGIMLKKPKKILDLGLLRFA